MKRYLTLLATLLIATLLGAAETPLSHSARMEAMKASSKLHYELFRKHYDHALLAMPLAEDINMIEETTGLTALSLACKDESADAIDMVQPLVAKYGADPDVVDAKGFTALHYAAYAGNHAVVEFLVKNGADIDVANPKAKGSRVTPLFLAYQKGRSRVADFLKLHGAKDIDPAVRRNLDLAAALSAAAAGLRDLPKNTDPQRALRIRLKSIDTTTSRTLQEQGRLEELKAWEGIKDQLMQAIEDTPIEPGMSRTAYIRQVMAKMPRSFTQQE